MNQSLGFLAFFFVQVVGLATHNAGAWHHGYAKHKQEVHFFPFCLSPFCRKKLAAL
jgi:hypothetical protein